MPQSDDNLKKKNIHAGHRERLRKRFLEKGMDALDDHQILEFLLFHCNRVKDTNPMGHALMDRFKNLDAVFSASYDDLIKVDGISDAAAALILFVSQLSNRVSRSTVPRKAALLTQRAAGEYCMKFFKGLKKERVVLVCLDSERNVISADIISEGVSNASVVDVRKIVEIAMNKGAVGVVLAHNHPDDATHPSNADVSVTTRIVNVLEGINISVIDHIICNNETFTSMSERGLMDDM